MSRTADPCCLGFRKPERVLRLLFILIWMLGNFVNGGNATEAKISELDFETHVRSQFEMLFPQEVFNGTCNSVNVNSDIRELARLNGCRVVVGSVTIILADEVDDKSFVNFTFPQLVEITDYLMIYRVSGVKSLNKLFPNLALIRGRELFHNSSLIISECEDLEEIGLINLQTIEKGDVRIERNHRLCFADRIDWTLIAKSSNYYIEENQIANNCPDCGGNCTTSRGKHCWNLQNCQVECNCHGDVCAVKSKQCCDSTCAGGCDENDPKKCKACKQVNEADAGNVECRQSCEDGTYLYRGNRCITKPQCTILNLPGFTTPPQEKFVPFNGECKRGCPPGHIVFKKLVNIYDCRRCSVEECAKHCRSPKMIDSVMAASLLKGCQIIDGPLEIMLLSSKHIDPSKSIVAELDSYLSDIVEIRDYLKIIGTYPIKSLQFLKSLKRIRGEKLDSGKYSLVLYNNANIQALWEDQEVEISQGMGLFAENPMLCYYKIEKLMGVSRIEDVQRTKKYNGQKAPCSLRPLNVSVVPGPTNAVFSWVGVENTYSDDISAISYDIYYLPTKENVTKWVGRDACGNDGWMVQSVSDFAHYPLADITGILTNLEPMTRYAYYVEADISYPENTGVQSEIQYFETPAGTPEKVTFLRVKAKVGAIVVTWEKPEAINGEFSHYFLSAVLIGSRLTFNETYACDSTYVHNVEPETPLDQDLNITSIEDEAFDNYCVNCDHPSSCIFSISRQLEIDFEHDVYDKIYVRHDRRKRKRKREAPEITKQAKFREHDTKIYVPAPETRPMGKVNQFNDNDRFIEFYEDIVNESQLSYEIKNLVDFSFYNITVTACRKSVGGENPCGENVSLIGRTLKNDKNDLITTFDVQGVSYVDSKQSLKVAWTIPSNPNGQLLSYIIRYKNADDKRAEYQYYCMPHEDGFTERIHIIGNLSGGEYIVQIATRTTAGMGEYTAEKKVQIPSGRIIPSVS